MLKKTAFILCLMLFVVFAIPVYAETETLLKKVTFDDGDLGLFQKTDSIDYEVVTGDGVGFSDDAALKVTHIKGENYTSYNNAVIMDMGTGLAPGGVYRIIVRFYAPREGNEGKGTLTGPGIVLNGDYPGDQGIVKFPTDFGTMPLDEWKEIDVTLPMQVLPITNIHFRFVINEEQKHADVWYIDDIEIYQVGELAEVKTPEWDLSLQSLSEAYKEYFLFGNAIETNQMDNSAFTAMYKRYFSAVTAGNAMKPAYLAPTKGVYTFGGADPFIKWARDNNIPVHGHTLAWHSQSADWLTKNDDGTPLTRAEAKANLEDYINNVAGHFKGDVISWDVVNEAFTNSVSPNVYWKDALRKNDSPWYLSYANGADTNSGESGADYIYDAFVSVRLTDPGAVLYYNDFNEEEEGKSFVMAEMTNELNALWKNDERNTEVNRLLIEGIGMQSHYFTDNLNTADVESAIVRFISTGAVVSISELDVVYGSYSSYTSRKELLNADELQKQAGLYEDLFKIYLKYADSIERVTIWGIADSMSWRAAGYPLLFDAYYEPKEAFWAVLNAPPKAPEPEPEPEPAPEIQPTDAPPPEDNSRQQAQTAAEAQKQPPVGLGSLMIGIIIVLMVVVAAVIGYLKRRR